jgi:hypothetical protein
MRTRSTWNPELNRRCGGPALREVAVLAAVAGVLGLAITGALVQDNQSCAWVASNPWMVLPFACAVVYFQNAGNLYDLALVALEEVRAGWMLGIFVVSGGMITGIATTWILVVASRLLPVTGGVLRRIDLVVAPLVVLGLSTLVIAVGSGEADETLLEVTRVGSRLQLAWVISAAFGSLYYGLGRLGERLSSDVPVAVEELVEMGPDYEALSVAYAGHVNGPLNRRRMSTRS